jgi:hypothetical protein
VISLLSTIVKEEYFMSKPKPVDSGAADPTPVDSDALTVHTVFLEPEGITLDASGKLRFSDAKVAQAILAASTGACQAL